MNFIKRVKMGIRILEPKLEYTVDYPQALKFVEDQTDILWFPEEIEVEKDLHSLKTDFTESEYHGVVSTLKLFTLYELHVGNEYWSSYVSKVFPRPDIQRMANCFSFFELNIHAPFYNKINELLGLDNAEFYNSYLDDEVLKNRMGWIAKRVSKKETLHDKLKSVGIFSMIEGAILYSSFAFLKHFNSNGKNKLAAINSGVNFSANDETLHSIAGAWLFRTLLQEAIDAGEITQEEIDDLRMEFETTAQIIRDHEYAIIQKMFEKGPIKNISAKQLINFVESRLDICLQNLGFKAIFKPTYNPIKEWFYLDLESSTLHDFFNTTGNDYSRDWIEARFVW